MLRFIFACALAVISLTSQAFVATPSKTLNASKYGVAIDGNYTYWASCEVNGSDVTYVVYQYRFPAVEATFTLKNVITDDVNPTYVPVVGTGYDVIVVNDIFSDDNKWCVILYNYKDSKCYIYNEDGEMLGELPTNKDGETGYFRMGSVTQGPTVYFTMSDGDSFDYGEHIIWSFEEGNSVKSVEAASAKIVAYPNPIPSGETLTVALPNPADSNTIISVIDLSGKQLLRQNVSAGHSEVKVSANLLSTGANIYTVIYSNGESYTGKIIKE